MIIRLLRLLIIALLLIRRLLGRLLNKAVVVIDRRVPDRIERGLLRREGLLRLLRLIRRLLLHKGALRLKLIHVLRRRLNRLLLNRLNRLNRLLRHCRLNRRNNGLSRLLRHIVVTLGDGLLRLKAEIFVFKIIVVHIVTPEKYFCSL